MRSLAKFSLYSQRSWRTILKLTLWFSFGSYFVKSNFTPSLLRKVLLLSFGANLGKRIVLRRGIRVHFPWNLNVGDDCWIGEEVWFINHEKINIGSNVCISQRSIICSGGHNYRSASLEYAHKPIEIKNGAWICLDAKILPGVTIGECSVVSAGEIARKSVPDYSLLVGGEIILEADLRAPETGPFLFLGEIGHGRATILVVATCRSPYLSRYEISSPCPWPCLPRRFGQRR